MATASPTESPDREIRLTEIPGELRRLRDEAEQYRQRAALEFTRAEAAERRARHAEIALEDWRRIAQSNTDQAEQRVADWRKIAEEQAERAAKAEIEAARWKQDSADDVRAANLAHELADKVEADRESARKERDEARALADRYAKQIGEFKAGHTRLYARIEALEAELAAAKREWSPDRASVEWHRRRAREAQGEADDFRDQLADVLKNDAVGKDCDTCDGTGSVSDIEPRHCGGPTNAYYEKAIVGDCEDCFGGRVIR